MSLADAEAHLMKHNRQGCGATIRWGVTETSAVGRGPGTL